MSIRTRILLATNLLVVAIGLVVGWLAIEVAGRELERKLVDESVTEAAALIRQMDLPRTSDDLLRKVGQILRAEAAVAEASSGRLVAASLPAETRRQLADRLRDDPAPRRAVIGDVAYRIGAAPLPPSAASPGQEPMRLYLLVPEARIAEARGRVAGTVALLTVGALVVATGIAFWISRTIARPVRRLAAHMERLSSAAAAVDPDALLGAGPSEGAAPGAEEAASRAGGERGPTEIARLTASFDRLMGQLGEARSRLARSARLATVGQFSAAIAHELRNPLSGIKMNARVLADELKRLGVDDESLTMILREIDRMDARLQELLALAAEGQGPPEASGAAATQSVRLAGEAASVLELLAGRCRHAGIAVESAVDPAATIRGDPDRLRQVILNLALNAVEAMPEGGRLRLTTAPGDRGAVRLLVADTGRGVRVPEGRDVFDAFVTTKPGGTGLGLHVSRRIVAQLGGAVGFESSPEGSTFWFELPGAE